jgi:hypothetical protein
MGIDSLSPDSGTSKNRKLRRADGDFNCIDGKLYIFGSKESILAGTTSTGTAAKTTVGIALGTGGVRSEQRVFPRAVNGDIMMEAQRQVIGLYLFVVPIVNANTYYLRWESYREP